MSESNTLAQSEKKKIKIGKEGIEIDKGFFAVNEESIFGDIRTICRGALAKHKANARRKLYNADKVFEIASECMEETPKESLLLPPRNLLLSSFEGIDYTFEEPVLRIMFENLLKKAFNVKTANFVHPLFANIIKNMTPSDAAFFAHLKYGCEFAVADVVWRSTVHDETIIWGFRNLYIDNPSFSDPISNQLAINVLEHHGLICVMEDMAVTNYDYERFKKTLIYLGEQENCKQPNEKDKDLAPFVVEIKPKVLLLTPFGSCFQNAVMPICL